MKIALVGDIALFGRNNVHDAGWKVRFSEIKSILNSCDYVIGNLETPLTNCTKVVGGKSAYIKGTPGDVEILKYLGVSHVSLANNHMFDFREKGLFDTIACLEKNGIGWFGVDEKALEINGKIALLGYCCYSTNAVGLERRGHHINLLDPKKMDYEIGDKEAKGLLPIVSCHWGQEHVHFPNYDHIEVARGLAKKHNIVIHGHHPHVIQGIECVAGSLINYSFGNFCFDDVYTPKSTEPLVKLSQDNQESYILLLDVKQGRLLSYEVIPFSFEKGYYFIKNSVKDRIQEWSLHLNDKKDAYIDARNAFLQDYYVGRKRQRDFHWYVKRLNPDSALMMIKAKRNKRNYNSVISTYLAGR